MSATSDVQETATLNLATLLDAGDGAVVTLVAGETKLAAHRAVLSARSPVFKAMFGHDMQEASSGVVSIPDVEGPVLRQLLAYLYTLQAPPLPDTAPQLLAAADKYGLSALKAACERQVAKQLEVENAAAAAVLAVRHSCPSLTAAAVDFIRANPQVMATRGWADATRSQVEDLTEVSRLIANPPIQTRAPATTGGRPTASTKRNTHSRTTDAAAAATAPDNTPPLDANAVNYFRSLSGEDRVSCLMLAAKEGAVGEVRALLAVGVDLGADDESGKNALHWAAQEGQVETARCLIQGGAYVGARDNYLRTPLHLAADGNHADVVRLLLAASAHPNARDCDERTPLHLAAEYYREEVMALLLEAGADRRARDKWGRTPST